MAKILSAIFFILTVAVANSQSTTMKYVLPTGSSSSLCLQGEQCFTLDEYASQPDRHFLSNTVFNFLRGIHQLTTNVTLQGVQNISFVGDKSESEVKLSLSVYGSLTVIDCENIKIESLSIEITGPGSYQYALVFINTDAIFILNTTVAGKVDSIGCSPLVFESSTLEVTNSTFHGLVSYHGSITLSSQTYAFFAGNNSFTNNTARIGGAIYSIDSAFNTSGTIHFTSNRAALRDDNRDECSKYSYRNTSDSFGFGGAIFGDNSQIFVAGAFTFVNNRAQLTGGAISVINKSVLTMESDVASQLGENVSMNVSRRPSFARNGVTLAADGYDFDYISSYGSGGSIYAQDSQVDLLRATFVDNMSPVSGGVVLFNHSRATMHNVTMVNNSAAFGGAIGVVNEAELNIGGQNCFERNSVSRSGGSIYVSSSSNATITGVNVFNKNSARRGGALYVLASSAQIDGSTTFDENLPSGSRGRGSALYLNEANVAFKGLTCFHNNSAGPRGRGGAVYMFNASLSFTGGSYFRSNEANRGGAIYLSDARVIFHDNTYFYENRADSRGGVMYVFRSSITLNGPEENVFEENYVAGRGGVAYLADGSIVLGRESSTTSFSRNTADLLGGAILSYDGYLHLRGEVRFNTNRADYGGALALYGMSRVRLNPTLRVNLTNNRANFDGGAIYFADSVSSSQCTNIVPVECFVTIGSDSFENISLNFLKNSAQMSGNALYGGLMDSCRLYFGNNLSDSTLCQDRSGNSFSSNGLEVLRNISTISLSDISSPPVRICVCENESIHICNKDINVAVRPGQKFSLSIASLGQARHIVNSTVLSKNVFFSNDHRLSPAIQLTGKSTCTQVTYRLFASVTNVRARYQLYFDGPCQSLNRGLDLNIDVLPCPVGFKLLGEECVCEESIKNFTESCFIDNVSIERATNNFWISQQMNDSGPIDGVVIHQSGCPFDYCMSSAINVTLDNPDLQCDNNRSGVLCGTCKENFSLALGSLHCLPCSNSYLALIIPFALAGITLILILFLLQLTVAGGTINGLIFYANIVQANQQAFFPRETINFFTVFIAWLNLDLGIETCFYRGLNIYVYSWLQFLFPFYVWLLIIIIITASHYSQRIARWLGQNPVAVLATLLLTSYSKILTAIITPLTKTYLYRSVHSDFESSSTVWLFDANRAYFRDPGHVVLGLFAFFALLFLFLPYTILLLFGHWIQTKSQWRVLSWINKLKPFMDAYYAPYKNKARYWTGFLLLTRCGLFLTFAFNSDGGSGSRVNLLAVSSACIALAVLKERVYDKHYNDILESFFILNLCIFSVATLFIIEDEGGSQHFLSGLSVGVSFVVFCGIILFHVYLRLSKTAPWEKVMTYLEKNHTFSRLLGKRSPGKEEQHQKKEGVELASLERRTTELTFEQTLSNSTVIVLREPLLDHPTY